MRTELYPRIMVSARHPRSGYTHQVAVDPGAPLALGAPLPATVHPRTMCEGVDATGFILVRDLHPGVLVCRRCG